MSKNIIRFDNFVEYFRKNLHPPILAASVPLQGGAELH
jgi:hypothetical protein